MRIDRYDIVRQDSERSAIWLEAVSDVNTAEFRIQQLASYWPGEFRVMDQHNHQIVAWVNGSLASEQFGLSRGCDELRVHPSRIAT